MQDDLKNAPIGFFDSGLGGLSVLRKALEMMPNENYIYYGDSKHAPYGEKTPQEIRSLSFNAIEFLIKKGAKAIVIACNTATSAAAHDLREYYKDIPIIGIEPALKPAIKLHETGSVIVMATKATLTQEKFKNLMDKYGEHREVIPLPCPGLVEFIEAGNLEGEEVKNFLRNFKYSFRMHSLSFCKRCNTRYCWRKSRHNRWKFRHYKRVKKKIRRK